MSVAGTYEYVKPGSMQKSTQKLTLTADGRVEYSETGSTGMEDFEAVGQGQNFYFYFPIFQSD